MTLVVRGETSPGKHVFGLTLFLLLLMASDLHTYIHLQCSTVLYYTMLILASLKK